MKSKSKQSGNVSFNKTMSVVNNYSSTVVFLQIAWDIAQSTRSKKIAQWDKCILVRNRLKDTAEPSIRTR